MVSGAAGLHKDVGLRLVEEKGPEASAREAMLLMDPTRHMRDGNLEDGLCEIDRDLSSVHRAPHPRVAFEAVDWLWHAGAVGGEESIPSIAADAVDGNRLWRLLQFAPER